MYKAIKFVSIDRCTLIKTITSIGFKCNLIEWMHLYADSHTYTLISLSTLTNCECKKKKATTHTHNKIIEFLLHCISLLRVYESSTISRWKQKTTEPNVLRNKTPFRCIMKNNRLRMSGALKKEEEKTWEVHLKLWFTAEII